MCENTCFLQSEDILGHFQTVALKFCFFLCIEGKTDKFRGFSGFSCALNGDLDYY